MTGGENGAVGEYVSELLADPVLKGQISFHRLFPGAPPEYGETRRPWPTAISNLLAERGLRLYSHQALAMDHIRAGHSIVASTPTASGKSLIYNLPVLERTLHDPDSRALYLFPLKALAQDQLASFRALCSSWPEDARPSAALYDGDTSEGDRKKIRKSPPSALITNPEMLHLGILPYHQSWATFLANLDYVVVDEAHSYRGVFGSHMANVFRRLNRVAGRYGAEPVYVFCTATLGNPADLAKALMGGGEPPFLVDKSGAPQGPRHFLFVNPEKATSTCAIDLLKRGLEKGLRSIVYCKSRRMTELVSSWASAQAGPFKSKISPYRAGYLREERRDIEARMASGELMSVVSTSALELGIDIGGLDLCILAGYPGTIMQTLQRGGRVGRSKRESAVIIVAGEDALDQYFARNPEEFFSRRPEKAVVNPDNETILARHLECAASEMPLARSESWLASPACSPVLKSLEKSGALALSADGSQWLSNRRFPQRGINLRSGGQSYAIEDEAGNIIGLMDGYRAWKETHPGAVYLHKGKSYVIGDLDTARGRIMARAQNVKWFTRARCKKSTSIVAEHERRPVGRCLAIRGRLRIEEQVTGYEKRAASGNNLISITPLDAPPFIFETDGLWYVIPDNIRMSLEERFLHYMGSIHAMEHAIIRLLPLEALADSGDFGGISIPMHPQLGLSAVFVYDGLPGGAGLTTAVFPVARAILESTRKAIAACRCEDGCPSCIHSPRCGAGNRPLSKEGSLALLAELLAPGPEGESLAAKLRISPPPDSTPESCDVRIEGQDFFEMERVETPADRLQAPGIQIRSAPPEHYVVFDVETRRSAREVGGWDKAGRMGVSVAVAYDSQAGDFFFYEQEELAPLFERMRAADLIIGFNSIRFDYKVLEPFAIQAGFGGSFFRDLPSLDILRHVWERIHCRVSLDNFGRSTLNVPKSADGLEALRWWREGRMDEIKNYCRDDVRITRDLYLYGLEKGHLLYSNKAGARVLANVDFSFPFRNHP